MREITAYQASDGTLHLREEKAREHDDDLLGQELDGLLRLFDLNITRTQEYRGLLSVMKKRADLLNTVKAITIILENDKENAME
jgi:hypothetical protein